MRELCSCYSAAGYRQVGRSELDAIEEEEEDEEEAEDEESRPVRRGDPQLHEASNGNGGSNGGAPPMKVVPVSAHSNAPALKSAAASDAR